MELGSIGRAIPGLLSLGYSFVLCSVCVHPGWEVMQAREILLTPDLVALGPGPSLSQ